MGLLIFALIAITLLISPSQAQAQPDWPRIITVIEGQRNTALTNHALAEARAAALAEEVAKLKAEIEALRQAQDEGKKAAPPK